MSIIIELHGRAGGRVLVDDADAPAVRQWSWTLGKGYAIRTERSGRTKRTVRLHRWLMGLKPGDPRQVDHRNGDPLDCRRSNMRLTDQAGNAQNRKVNRTSRSGIRGVRRSLRHRSKPWVAHARINGRQRTLGYFATADEAARCAAEARRLHMPLAVDGR